MVIGFTTLGIAFAAFFVWLTVQIINRRHQWSKWTALAVAIAVLLAYPLSIGPVMSCALWLGSGPDTMTSLTSFYLPVFSMMRRSEASKRAMNWCLSVHTNGRMRQK
jgi:hypothetical protein